jgi:hypothetical protein
MYARAGSLHLLSTCLLAEVWKMFPATQYWHHSHLPFTAAAAAAAVVPLRLKQRLPVPQVCQAGSAWGPVDQGLPGLLDLAGVKKHRAHVSAVLTDRISEWVGREGHARHACLQQHTMRPTEAIT